MYDDSTAPDDERQHRVKMTKGYYIGVYEVTQQEFQRVMGHNPSMFSPHGRLAEQVNQMDTSRFPVEMVSLDTANVFCEKLSRLTAESSAKRKYRLPTEAEWEYACRAGSTTTYHFGDSLNGTNANCHGTKPFGTNDAGPFLDRTTTVGSYKPNAWGLYDMHGNVAEWCSDFLSAEYYHHSPASDPPGPTLEQISNGFDGSPGELIEVARAPRVRRGGGYHDRASFCRSAARPVYCAPLASDTGSSIGFRVVVEIGK
ncbi:MAG: formylglycine-generating enzyme family protein [Pirellulales bacterium]